LMVTSIYPTPEKPAFGINIWTQAESLKRVGVDVEVLVLKGRPRKLIYPKGMFELRRRLADGSIDLVHAHYGFAGMVARTQWKAPVVVSYLGDDLLGTRDPQGNITLFSKVAVAAGQMLARMVDAAIVMSKEMASKLNAKNVYITPTEIDFEVFRTMDRERARAMLGLDPGKKYLLFAANPQIPVKRFSLAKAVADQLAKQDPSIELLVVSKETQDRLAIYMNACDALVFPSYQEGSPSTVKQAMACNLPIVATDVGDVREVIGDTKWCYVCNPDVTEFVERLNEILQVRERTQGRQYIQHLDCPTMAQQIIKIYEATLNPQRSGSASNELKAF
jgi:teichuronic acid biosynthesis glycosyltransferase TuaC